VSKSDFLVKIFTISLAIISTGHNVFPWQKSAR
jgi:hypothetical protein